MQARNQRHREVRSLPSGGPAGQWQRQDSHPAPTPTSRLLLTLPASSLQLASSPPGRFCSPASGRLPQRRHAAALAVTWGDTHRARCCFTFPALRMRGSPRPLCSCFPTAPRGGRGCGNLCPLGSGEEALVGDELPSPLEGSTAPSTLHPPHAPLPLAAGARRQLRPPSWRSRGVGGSTLRLWLLR